MELKQFYALFTRFRCRGGHVSRRLCNAVAGQGQKEDIVIPPRVERGPTDILRALASTVTTDFTAPHYKYHDDPYLIPSSNIGKRTFALAKESGRKAAQWIKQEHPEFFNAKTADPVIPMFLPRAVYTEDSVVSEDDLRQVIAEARVSDALKVMELLEKNKQEVSLQTRQRLLEQLCFYNAEDSVSTDLVEERWFTQGQQRGRPRKTWKDGGAAEQVFSSLQLSLAEDAQGQEHFHRATCTLIRGMAKYCQVDKAWEMYQALRADHVKVDSDTYEALIRAASFLRDGNEARWQLVEELLKDMAASDARPELGTMNAVLEVLSTTAGWRQARSLALRTLAEFRPLGVRPCLASYYFLLTIFCRERGPTSSLLEEIVTELEQADVPLRIQDPKDTFFFVTAMDVCRNHLGDPGLARRLHALLHAHDNYDLIGDSYKESIYYRHLFTLLCTLEPLESFMQMYDKYVPNIYIPEPSVMEEIVRAVELHEAWSLLPRLWADLLVFDQVDRLSLVTLWLKAAVCADARLPQSGEEVCLAAQLCTCAAQLWEKVENQPDFKTNIIRWDGPMLGDVMQLALRAGQFEFACQALAKLQGGAVASAPPDLQALRDFLEAAVTNNSTDKVAACLEYAIDAGFPEAAVLVTEHAGQLSAQQQSRLQSLLGRV